MTFVVYRGGKKYTIVNAALADYYIDRDLLGGTETLLTLKENDLINLRLNSLLTISIDDSNEKKGIALDDVQGIFCDTQTIQ